ncbi:MAG: hypothetical protein LUD41_04540 [Phascolarctobacterium sp.]|nr:hypothetical protein [Phascolarctobacterium sp.]
MFTGLVTEMGSVENLAQQEESYHLTVKAAAAADLEIGDSVAVNGACLTVVAKGDGSFTADVMPETVRHTNIGGLNTGDKVNLETDILAKYVEKMLGGSKKCTDPLITKAMLFENGFA